MAEIGETGPVGVIENPAKIGVGRREDIDPSVKPVRSSFGEHHSRTDFELGCRPEEVIRGNGVVMFETASKDGAVQNRVTIGKMPEDIETDGPEWANAGIPGPYLMSMETTRVDRSSPGTPPVTYNQFFYLDATDLSGVVVEKKKQTIMAPNPQRKRAFPIQGLVTSVYALN